MTYLRAWSGVAWVPERIGSPTYEQPSPACSGSAMARIASASVKCFPAFAWTS